MALWNASFINAVPLFDLRWVLIHSRTIRVLYSKESPSLLDKALIAQNKALPTVLLPESLIPVMTVKPPKTVLYPVRIPDKFRRKIHVQM